MTCQGRNHKVEKVEEPGVEVLRLSRGAQVITENANSFKKDGKYKRFCSYFNNGDNVCKREENCKYLHEQSKKCKQFINFTKRSCQFKHSRDWLRLVYRRNQKSQEVKSPGDRVVREETINSLEKLEEPGVGVLGLSNATI